MRNGGGVERPPCTSRATSPVTLIVITTIMCVLSGILTGSVCIEASGAGNDGIVIEADTTEYRFEPEGTVVVAKGNAKVIYEDFFVSADYVSVQAESGELLASGSVASCQGTQSVECDLLSYNLYTGKGRILEPDAHISGLYVRGSEMNLAPGTLALHNAHVTGCELDFPCYRVGAKRIVIYPNHRAVVEWPILWFGKVPLVVLPKLVLPLDGDRIAFAEGGSIPLPKLSYDSSDGFLIGLSYLDKTHDWAELRYEGSYSSRRRGVKLSAKADLALEPGRTGVLEGIYSSWEGFSASARYGMSVLNSVNLDASFRYVPEESSEDPAKWRGFGRGAVEARLVAQTAGGSPIKAKATVAKDVRTAGDVYRVPEIEISLKPLSIPGGIGSLTLSGGLGRFKEPSRSVEAGRHHLAASYASPAIRFSKEVSGSLTLGVRRAWYETLDMLDSFTAGARLRGSFGETEAFGKTVPQVKAGIGYDFTYVQGASPFSFDTISAVNKGSANIDYRVNEDWSIGLSTSYDFTKESIDDIGVLLSYHKHCYDIQAAWHKKQQAFGIEMKFHM